MIKLFSITLTAILLSACLKDKGNFRNQEDNEELTTIYENYYEGYLRLNPLEATGQGDYRYNDQLPIDISTEYRNKKLIFYQKYLNELLDINREELNANDKITYDTFQYSLKNNINELGFNTHLIPFDQFWGLPLTLGQLGSGDGSQPFKTVEDYEKWLKRLNKFSAWADTAVVNFRQGMLESYVLPKALVTKMIPQMQGFVVEDPTQSLFYGPIKRFPEGFSESDRIKLTGMYKKTIREEVVPAYKRLHDFLKNDYYYRARSSSGIADVPQGSEYYKHLITQWTTTQLTPDEIYQTGIDEVARITTEMEKVKAEVGFEGELQDFFVYIKTNKRFYPYQTPEQVITAFEEIHQKVIPNVEKIFTKNPKTAFEIRRTEAFREATASAEYNQGTPDGSRPGIFYIPIPDARKFNITSGMESLFLHEAIPGHHYQVSLQQENMKLPKFMRFGWYGAYGEGWALYCESLGKELGLYTDPYQYMGALGDEMHRAIRLVVDVGLHSKAWTREEAIAYMLKNEPADPAYATMEIERYMAIPGQALSYKIGQLKIIELRKKYEKQLGKKFNLAAFHDELLNDGCLPLEVLERKMDAWAEAMIGA
jgi:uncharacterized protein (DUF885 family)